MNVVLLLSFFIYIEIIIISFFSGSLPLVIDTKVAIFADTFSIKWP